MKKLITPLMLGMMASSTFASSIADYAVYRKAVNETSKMNRDVKARANAKAVGLDILNVTWEDTGRAQGSSMGPNISDMTIQVHTINEKGDIAPVAMPVLRYPNFSDKTADISPNKFFMLVGNEKGEALKKVSLTEYLDNFRSYLSDASSWKGDTQSLLAARDSHVLVSAQSVFLPVPKGQKAHFNPVLFNYQSSENNPAVLTILATREGTSATIIDNKRDAFKSGWGQRLFFNTNGEKASLTAERLSDFMEKGVESDNTGVKSLHTANGQDGKNMVMLIQVPLVHKARRRVWPMFAMSMAEGFPMQRSMTRVEDAVIGHGPVEGNYVEIDDLEIKRDERFPIRVTVQFYKATTDATLTKSVAKGIRKQIDQVYKNADFVGSLVTEGTTGRPTEHNVKYCSPVWWPIYWAQRAEAGLSSEKEIVKKLRRHYGPYWVRYCRNQELFNSAVEFVSK